MHTHVTPVALSRTNEAIFRARDVDRFVFLREFHLRRHMFSCWVFLTLLSSKLITITRDQSLTSPRLFGRKYAHNLHCSTHGHLPARVKPLVSFETNCWFCYNREGQTFLTVGLLLEEGKQTIAWFYYKGTFTTSKKKGKKSNGKQMVR